MYAYAAISIGDILIGSSANGSAAAKGIVYFLRHHGIVHDPVLYHSVERFGRQDVLDLCRAWIRHRLLGHFVTMAAEQFGTNLRATAATTIPNMVRGMLAIFILPLFQLLRNYTDYISAGWISAIIMLITIVAAAMVEETFGKDPNYTEN